MWRQCYLILFAIAGAILVSCSISASLPSDAEQAFQKRLQDTCQENHVQCESAKIQKVKALEISEPYRIGGVTDAWCVEYTQAFRTGTGPQTDGHGFGVVEKVPTRSDGFLIYSSVSPNPPNSGCDGVTLPACAN